MGNSNPKETCPSEMINDVSQETCPSDIANHASQNFIASYEKEEMEHFEVIITWSSMNRKQVTCSSMLQKLNAYKYGLQTAGNDKHKCIGGKEENIKERISRIYEMICQEDIYRSLCEDIYRSLCLLEKDKEQIEREEREERKRIKLMIYLLLLSILFGNNGKCKFLATPDRGKISCINVYLLGNDGAHSYNGNGILLATRRKYVRLTDVELLDEIRPANIPLDVLQRQPTDKEIARLSGKIGQEYRRLAYELGLTRVQLDHLTEDCRVTEHRIESMLFKWRDGNGKNKNKNNPTFEVLVNALDIVGINPDIVYQSLDRA